MRTLNVPFDTEIAWCAGFIDGEGCIYIQPCTPHGRSKETTYILSLNITNVDYDTINRIKSMWGIGRIGKKVRYSENHSSTFYFIASANQALYILKSVLPYLVTKRKEAEIAIKFQEENQLRTGQNPIKGKQAMEELQAIRHKVSTADIELEDNFQLSLFGEEAGVPAYHKEELEGVEARV